MQVVASRPAARISQFQFFPRRTRGLSSSTKCSSSLLVGFFLFQKARCCPVRNSTSQCRWLHPAPLPASSGSISLPNTSSWRSAQYEKGAKYTSARGLN
ncbi:hypothetical protein BC832DRAFT_298908 [Gaertneriomyces semiglobifer]|nr:hypothetical protein BC832DRAFT_298908 [Gaertneriomyces semiglobifer]